MNDAPILFMARHPARPGIDPAEVWEAAMVCAAFDRRTTVLLLGEAVELLQGASGVALANALDAGVEAICIEAAQTARVATDCPIPFQSLDAAALRTLLAAHPIVISV